MNEKRTCWQEGQVDPEGEHVRLTWHEPEPGEKRVSVARIAPSGPGTLAVEFLAKEALEHETREMLRLAREEIDNYLLEKLEPDPWRYAIHHCGTVANLHSSIRWSYCPSRGGPPVRSVAPPKSPTQGRRLPTDRCARCERTLSETGGQRLLVPDRFWTETEIEEAGGSMEIIRRMFKGEIPAGVVQQAPGGWSEEDLTRVRRAVAEADDRGLVAWVCQRCMHRVCRECGEPLVVPPCADVVDDAGKMSHGPYFGEAAGCTNPACARFKGKRGTQAP
ncbi:MAG: hypothetical protein HY720_14355 [Planctomycetes bacterium]|nr:hypothetical protein [Planctomycetota bacterium]